MYTEQSFHWLGFIFVGGQVVVLSCVTLAMVDECKLFVGNLPATIQQEDIVKVFSAYGNVTEVHMMRQGHQQPQAAFVLFDDCDSAKAAIEVLHGKYSFGGDDVMINVSVAVAKVRGHDSGDGGSRDDPGGRN